MDARMSIANMTTEWGALVGWFPPDEITRAYLHARRERLGDDYPLDGGAIDALIDDAALPDDDARYDRTLSLDLSTVSPHVSGPNTVKVITPLHEIEARRVPIQKAYVLSCVNSRLSDLEAANEAFSQGG